MSRGCRVPRPIGKRQKVAATPIGALSTGGTRRHTFTMAYTWPQPSDAPVWRRYGRSKSVADSSNPLYSSQL